MQLHNIRSSNEFGENEALEAPNQNSKPTRKKVLRFVCAISLFVCASAVVFVAFLATTSFHCPHKEAAAKSALSALKTAVLLFAAEHPDKCPTTEKLVRERYIDNASRTIDPWDTPYFLNCDAKGIQILSAGKDQTLGTSDDLVAAAE